MSSFNKGIVDDWAIEPLNVGKQIAELKILIEHFSPRFSFPEVENDAKSVCFVLLFLQIIR